MIPEGFIDELARSVSKDYSTLEPLFGALLLFIRPFACTCVLPSDSFLPLFFFCSFLPVLFLSFSRQMALERCRYWPLEPLLPRGAVRAPVVATCSQPAHRRSTALNR